MAKTREIWAFVRGILGDGKRDYIEENAICHDDEGKYVWKIIEPHDGSALSRSPLLKVEKVRVITGDQEVDFLGNWTFRDVVVAEGETFDYERDRVLGELVLPEGATELTGDTVLFERKQWLLRPGDMVGVDLNETRMPKGFYVPIDAINERSEKHYVFVVEGNESNFHVRQTQVNVSDGPNTLKRVESIGDQSLTAGTQIVLGGVHYLTDGEAVNVASEMEAN